MTTASASDLVQNPGDARRRVILDAAFEIFRNYGYRRTTMEDIARAAGMSRAALYLSYKNKQAIFRSLVQLYFEVATMAVQAALTPEMPPQTALSGVYAAKTGPEMEALFNSPHGAELLDANFAVCSDIVREGEGRIARILGDWLAAEAAAGRITLQPFGNDPQALAHVMISAFAGQKEPERGFAALVAAGERLAGLFGRSLLP